MPVLPSNIRNNQQNQQQQAPSSAGGFAEYMEKIKQENNKVDKPRFENRREERMTGETRELNGLDQVMLSAKYASERMANPFGFDYEKDNPLSNPLGWAATIPGGIISAPFDVLAKGGAAVTGTDIYTADEENNRISDSPLNAAERAASAGDAAISGLGLMAGGSGRALGSIGRGIKTIAGSAVKNPKVTSSFGQGAKNLLFDSGEEFLEETAQSYLGNIEEGVPFDTGDALVAGAYGALGGAVMSGAGMAIDSATNKFLNKNSKTPDPVQKSSDLWEPTTRSVDDIDPNTITGFAERAIAEKNNEKARPATVSGLAINNSELDINAYRSGLTTLKGALYSIDNDGFYDEFKSYVEPFLNGETLDDVMNDPDADVAAAKLNQAIAQQKIAGNYKNVDYYKNPRMGLAHLLELDGVFAGEGHMINGAISESANQDFDFDRITISFRPNKDANGEFVNQLPSYGGRNPINQKPIIPFDKFYTMAVSGRGNKRRASTAMANAGLDREAIVGLFDAMGKRGYNVDVSRPANDQIVEIDDYNEAMNAWMADTSQRLGPRVTATALSAVRNLPTNSADVLSKKLSEVSSKIDNIISQTGARIDPTDIETVSETISDNQSGSKQTPGYMGESGSVLKAATDMSVLHFTGDSLAIRVGAAIGYKRNDSASREYNAYDEMLAASMSISSLGRTPDTVLESAFSNLVFADLQEALNGRKLYELTEQEFLEIILPSINRAVAEYNESQLKDTLSGQRTLAIDGIQKSPVKDLMGVASMFARMYPDLNMSFYGFGPNSTVYGMSQDTYIRRRGLAPYRINAEEEALTKNYKNSFLVRFLNAIENESTLSSDRTEQALRDTIAPISNRSITLRSDGTIDPRDENTAMARAEAIQNIIGEDAVISQGLIGLNDFIHGDFADLFLSGNIDDTITMITKIKARDTYGRVRRLKIIYDQTTSVSEQDKIKKLIIEETLRVTTTRTHALIADQISNRFDFSALKAFTDPGDFPSGLEQFSTDVNNATELYEGDVLGAGMIVDILSGGATKIEMSALKNSLSTARKYFQDSVDAEFENVKIEAKKIFDLRTKYNDSQLDGAIKHLGENYMNRVDINVAAGMTYDALFVDKTAGEKNLNGANAGSFGDMMNEAMRGHLKSETKIISNAVLNRFNIFDHNSDRRLLWKFIYEETPVSLYDSNGKTYENATVADLMVEAGILTSNTVQITAEHRMALFQQFPQFISWLSRGVITANPLQDGTATSGTLSKDFATEVEEWAAKATIPGATTEAKVMSQIEQDALNTPQYHELIIYRMSAAANNEDKYFNDPALFKRDYMRAHNDLIKALYNYTATMDDGSAISIASKNSVAVLGHQAKKMIAAASMSRDSMKRILSYGLDGSSKVAKSYTEDIISSYVLDGEVRGVGSVSQYTIDSADDDSIVNGLSVITNAWSDLNTLEYFMLSYMFDHSDFHMADFSEFAITSQQRADMQRLVDNISDTAEKLAAQNRLDNVNILTAIGLDNVTDNILVGMAERLFYDTEIEAAARDYTGSRIEEKINSLTSSGINIRDGFRDMLLILDAESDVNKRKKILKKMSDQVAEAVFEREFRSAMTSGPRMNSNALADTYDMTVFFNKLANDLRGKVDTHSPTSDRELRNDQYEETMPAIDTSSEVMRSVSRMLVSSSAGAGIQFGVSSAGYDAKYDSQFGAIIMQPEDMATRDSKLTDFNASDLLRDFDTIRLLRGQLFVDPSGNEHVLDEDGINVLDQLSADPNAIVRVAIPWRALDTFDRTHYTHLRTGSERDKAPQSIWFFAANSVWEEDKNLKRKKNISIDALIAEALPDSFAPSAIVASARNTGPADPNQILDVVFNTRKQYGTFLDDYSINLDLGTYASDSFAVANVLIPGVNVYLSDGTVVTINLSDNFASELDAVTKNGYEKIMVRARSLEETFNAINKSVAYSTEGAIQNNKTRVTDTDMDKAVREGILSTDKKYIDVGGLSLMDSFMRMGTRRSVGTIDPILANNTTSALEWAKYRQDNRVQSFSIERATNASTKENVAINSRTNAILYSENGQASDTYAVINGYIEPGTSYWNNIKGEGLSQTVFADVDMGLNAKFLNPSGNRTNIMVAAINSENAAKDVVEWTKRKGINLAVPSGTPAERYVLASGYRKVGNLKARSGESLSSFAPVSETQRSASWDGQVETPIHRVVDDGISIAPITITALDMKGLTVDSTFVIPADINSGIYGRKSPRKAIKELNTTNEFLDIVGVTTIVKDQAQIDRIAKDYKSMLLDGSMRLHSDIPRYIDERIDEIVGGGLARFASGSHPGGVSSDILQRDEVVVILQHTPSDGGPPIFMPIINEFNGFPDGEPTINYIEDSDTDTGYRIISVFNIVIDEGTTNKLFLSGETVGEATKFSIEVNANIPTEYIGGAPISGYAHSESSIKRMGIFASKWSKVGDNLFYFTRNPKMRFNPFMRVNAVTGLYEPNPDVLSDTVLMDTKAMDSLNDPDSLYIANMSISGEPIVRDQVVDDIMRTYFRSCLSRKMMAPMRLFMTARNGEINGVPQIVGDSYSFEPAHVLSSISSSVSEDKLLTLFNFIDKRLCPRDTNDITTDHYFDSNGDAIMQDATTGRYYSLPVWVRPAIIGVDNNYTTPIPEVSKDGMQDIYMSALVASMPPAQAYRWATHMGSKFGYSGYVDPESVTDTKFLEKVKRDIAEPYRAQPYTFDSHLDELAAMYGDNAEARFLSAVRGISQTFSHRMGVMSDNVDQNGHEVTATQDEMNSLVNWFNRSLGYGAGDQLQMLTENQVVDILGMMVGYTYIPGSSYSVRVRDARVILSEFVNRVTSKTNTGENAYPIQGNYKFENRYTLALAPKEYMDVMWNIPAVKNKFATKESFIKAGVAQYQKAVENLSSMNAVVDGASYLKRKGALIEYSAFVALSNGLDYDVQPRLWAYRTVQDIVVQRDKNLAFLGMRDTVDTKFSDQMEKVSKALARIKSIEQGRAIKEKGTVVPQPNIKHTAIKHVSNIFVGNLLLNPLLMASNMGHRIIGQNMRGLAMSMGAWLGIGPYTGGLRPSSESLVIAKNNPAAILLWQAWNDAAFSGDDIAVIAQLSQGGVDQALDWIQSRKDPGLSSKYRDWTARAAAGFNFGINKQFELFIRRHFYLAGLRGGTTWDETSMNQMLSADGGVTQWLASVFNTDNPSPDLVNVLEARQWALGSDMNQKNILGEIYRLLTQNRPLAQLGVQAFLTPFVQYQGNRAGRLLQKVLPVSTINYVATTIFMNAENSGMIPGTGIMWEELRTQASVKEALIIDAMHIGAFNLALILAAAAWFEPPEDEDLYQNYREWTICGFRIADAWPLDDILGITLPLAAYWKSAAMGRANAGTLWNGIADATAGNPLVEMGAFVQTLIDPDTFMEEEYNDIADAWSDVPGGAPDVIEAIASNAAYTGLNVLNKFLVPTFVDSLIRESNEDEVSYKRIYEVDATGKPTGAINELSGTAVTQETTFFDAQLRRATRNHFALGLLANTVTGVLGKDGTGYTAGEMPKVVIYDPYQMASLRYFSMYKTDTESYDFITDASGNKILKSDRENQAMALEVQSLLETNTTQELIDMGFYLDAETKAYVSKTIWDQVYAVDDALKKYKASPESDFLVLGNGDFKKGQALAYEIYAMYDNEKDRLKSIYDTLYSFDLRQSMTTYNRYNTTWDQDADGEWYATGYRRSPFNIIAVAPTEGNLGSKRNWETESEVVSASSAGSRALEPQKTYATEYIDIEEWAGKDGGYSDIYPGDDYSDSDDDDNDSAGGYRYGGGGGGGGGYAPNLYSRLPNLPYVDTRTMMADRLYDTQFDYLRPGFEVKGSRESYKRQDI